MCNVVSGLYVYVAIYVTSILTFMLETASATPRCSTSGPGVQAAVREEARLAYITLQRNIAHSTSDRSGCSPPKDRRSPVVRADPQPRALSSTLRPLLTSPLSIVHLICRHTTLAYVARRPSYLASASRRHPHQQLTMHTPKPYTAPHAIVCSWLASISAASDRPFLPWLMTPELTPRGDRAPPKTRTYPSAGE